MTDLRFSVTQEDLSRGARGDQPRLGFLAEIAERGLPVELFVEVNAMSYLRADVSQAESLDLDVRTVHLPPLARGADEDGDVELNTHLKESQMVYEHDDGSVERRRNLAPELTTLHPPRFASDDADRETRRERLVRTLAASKDHRRAERKYRGPVALENVCPRGSFDYLLTTADDVTALRTTADRLGRRDVLAFTCDLGHARRPFELLDAVGSPASVHLHGTLPERATRELAAVCGTFGVESPAELAVEESVGEYHHLPPTVGTPSFERVVAALDERDIDCPLVVELQPAFRTAETVTRIADAFREVRS
ncbi:hypothetical protein [Halorussus sp. MSC15.2]|uniref:hypothetical protein n=1 Tax=Halorussus sp. MSC15.2 TaxID=2283638 RepID=UPI0013D64943|nr:hypothetical protein [Halorussus sp. MSC15.2]NEU57748.1 hypothetical protein [Halorussus sp. MSC15.2]